MKDNSPYFNFIIGNIEVRHFFFNRRNGALATLAPSTSNGQKGGLRRYIKAKADELGVTGVIIGQKRKKMELVCEGTHEQMTTFVDFLAVCQNQDMISPFTPSTHVPQLAPYRTYRDFAILVDQSMLFYKGEYSGDDFMKHEEDSTNISDHDVARRRCVIM